MAKCFRVRGLGASFLCSFTPCPLDTCILVQYVYGGQKHTSLDSS